jgi:hypothetical protein
MAKDFRSERMGSPEGKGLARKAWDEYRASVRRTLQTPAVAPLTNRLVSDMTADLMGFWLIWQLEGGFEGARRAGMSRTTIYRRIRRFRIATGSHPDEFQVPGVQIDVAAYLTSGFRILDSPTDMSS